MSACHMCLRTSGGELVQDLARDLIRRCLHGDVQQRLQTVDEVLQHPFINEKARMDLVVRRASNNGFGTRGAMTAGNAAAASEPTKSDVYPDGSYAVIIGINDYESAGVDPQAGGLRNLTSAREDGELMAETLHRQGFTILHELYDQDATHAAVNALLSNVKKQMRQRPRSRFVFFLATHGVLDEDDEGWVCCYGCDTTELERTCISMDFLRKFAKRLDATHQMYFLDMCHAGSFLEGTRAAPTKYEMALLNSPALYGMTAVTKDQEAIECEGHGIFTKLVVDGLNGYVETRGRNYVTATELFSYVQRGVLEEADRRKRKQVPKFQPLWPMHKKRSCDGQVLFFKDSRCRDTEDASPTAAASRSSHAFV